MRIQVRRLWLYCLLAQFVLETFNRCDIKQIAQDEAELLVGSALGVVEIQPFFMGCYGHLLDAWY